jgi:hypothetical protein
LLYNDSLTIISVIITIQLYSYIQFKNKLFTINPTDSNKETNIQYKVELRMDNTLQKTLADFNELNKIKHLVCEAEHSCKLTWVFYEM